MAYFDDILEYYVMILIENPKKGLIDMKQTIYKLLCALEQGDSMGLQEYIRILYEACEKHPYCNEADIRQIRDELEEYVVDLEFRKQDRILSTVNALCAAYDYAGFAEGFRRGGELILRLMEAQ